MGKAHIQPRYKLKNIGGPSNIWLDSGLQVRIAVQYMLIVFLHCNLCTTLWMTVLFSMIKMRKDINMKAYPRCINFDW